MDELFEKSLLYDFYGELLTEHQQAVYQSFVFEDMSLAEVAEEQGITRQGVHDLVKRCDKILQGYEDKLHLVEKFMKIKKLAGEIVEETGPSSVGCADSFPQGGSQENSGGSLIGNLERIKSLATEIIEEL